jgi:predicted metal-dependent hydrolase
MRLPDYLIDYVILHELCHTKEKNHGIKFWNLLDKCTDNKAKTLSKEINNYSTFIY